MMTTERDPDSENTPPRKRIAVAVQSPADFFDLDTTRAHFPDTLPTLTSSDMLGSYRHGSASAAAYPYHAAATTTAGKQSYYGAVPTWPTQGYTEDSVDYGLQYGQSHPYLAIEDEVRMVTAKSHSANRLGLGSTKFGASTHSGPSGNIYVDVDPGYPYTNSPALMHRPPMGTTLDLPHFSLAAIPQQHLHSSPSKDRLLPSPTRSLPSNGIMNYRAVRARHVPTVCYRFAGIIHVIGLVESSGHHVPLCGRGVLTCGSVIVISSIIVAFLRRRRLDIFHSGEQSADTFGRRI
ncbi:unnamed protein product [Parascedosporium putredinis]|uniref:Uncharacterized protein n=1 Tax=Parascedosporium putredinis TaxID=1442378 RepID=A0A9P1M779_9PEZI|nr:unnamed protein product [Parascedosporium putredinis]CAI7989952.1 unnamed protein product [Parascedosporium putredinis]